MTLITALICLSFAITTVLSNPPRPSGYSDDWFLLPDDNNGTLHWVDPHDTSPMPMVAESDVTFLLYTRQNPSNPTTIQTGVASSLGNFNANRQTKFVIHGWNSNGDSMATVRNGYVNSGLDLNIIVVDWQRPANQGYAQSMTNTRGVGVFVANHINWLVSRGLNVNNINIVGFSLGAHVAGIAGHNVHGTVGRITGLDPAGPLYINVAPEHHLDSGDAAHVQVIHTNGGTLGWKNDLGDIDFYPNGGSKQEGCGLDLIGTCSHGRVNDLFAESVTSDRFRGRQCDSWSSFTNDRCNSNAVAILGHTTPTNARGSYFLRTNGASPFALG